MTIRDILIFLFKWRTTILGFFLAIFFGVAFLAYATPQSYRGSAAVIIERNRAPLDRTSYAPGQDMIEMINTAAAIVKTRAVMEHVVDDLRPQERPRNPSLVSSIMGGLQQGLADIGLITKLPDREKWIERLLRSVRVEPVVSSDVLKIEYSDQDPEWAQKLTNAVTEAYIKHYLDIYATKGMGGTNPDLINVRLADRSSRPIAPRYSRLFLIFLGFAGGLLLGVMAALVREYFDSTVSDLDEMENILGIPAIGAIERVAQIHKVE